MMRLFLLDQSFQGQKTYTINGKDSHYIVDVLRLPIGQTITARDYKAGLWSLKLISIGKGSCTVQTSPLAQPCETTDSLPEYQDLKPLILYQCITRPKKLEQIVRQASEIGVRKIILVESRFCCREKIRMERLEAQRKEAIQQSGSIIPTEIAGPVKLSDIKDNSEGKALFFHQTSLPEQRRLGEVLADLESPTSILIGPEGGLDEYECSALIHKHFEPVLLDTNILRAETAAVYALSVVQTAIQNRN